jgi:nickel-dependent lactate racemase
VLIACAYLGADAELTEERERHIALRHPDLLPRHRDKLFEVLVDPDTIRRTVRHPSARTFSRWYADVRSGKHVVVVVVSDATPPQRHWVITAYMTRRLSEGHIEWQRS